MTGTRPRATQCLRRDSGKLRDEVERCTSRTNGTESYNSEMGLHLYPPHMVRTHESRVRSPGDTLMSTEDIGRLTRIGRIGVRSG